MYKDLIPIGSVVRVKGSERKMMIIGRVVTQNGNDAIFDYCACVFPEGIVSANHMYFFNRDAIVECEFMGYQDEHERMYHEQILDKLGELQVVDGQIVPKEF